MAYSAHEYIDMVITYGACGGNSHATSRLYAERFPERKQPNSSSILRCIHRLRETGSVFVTPSFRRQRGVRRRACIEEKILRAYENGKNVCHIARSFGVSRSNIYRILDRYEVRRFDQLNRDEKQRDTCEDVSNVSAIEKSTGKKNNIKITNDKSCLSKEDIEKTVNEAEKYRSEDEQQRERISAKNALELYCSNMKSTIDTIKDKIDASDKEKVLFKCNEVISWLEANQLAEKEKFVDKQKELEAICNPIVTELYQSGGTLDDFPDTGGAESNPSDGTGPTIEKVD
ncbi:HS71L protein, partial [Acromyrmex charruanus]